MAPVIPCQLRLQRSMDEEPDNAKRVLTRRHFSLKARVVRVGRIGDA